MTMDYSREHSAVSRAGHIHPPRIISTILPRCSSAEKSQHAEMSLHLDTLADTQHPPA
jgi:hypothetical protein